MNFFPITHLLQQSHASYRPPIHIEECKLIAAAHEGCLDVTHFETVK